jgi:hypothetical protein
MFRAVNWAMAALFGLAAALQYNDPDPLRWVGIYAAAMLVAIYAATRGVVPPIAPLVVAGVALIWGLIWSTGIANPGTYARMFDRWEMRNVGVEEARETSGLLIVTAWMAVLALHGWSQRRAMRQRKGENTRPPVVGRPHHR